MERNQKISQLIKKIKQGSSGSSINERSYKIDKGSKGGYIIHESAPCLSKSKCHAIQLDSDNVLILGTDISELNTEYLRKRLGITK